MAALIARFGAKTLFVLATAGLMASTAGNATITPGTVQVIKSLEEPVPAPAEEQSLVDQAVEPDAEHVGDGEASYYGHELAGNRTASGERLLPDPDGPHPVVVGSPKTKISSLVI